MNTDPQILLLLLAIRLHGAQVPASAEVFKGLKTALKTAKDQNLVSESTISLPVTTKAGKSSMKKTAALVLTEQGENLLRQAASPEMLAATAAGQMQALQQGLAADRLALREEILKATTAKGAGKAKDLVKDWAGLAADVKKLGERLGKIESTLQTQGGDAVLERIDQAFSSLREKLTKAGSPTTASPVSGAASSATTPESLQSQLRNSYQKLCRFVEFEDGLVEIPRLFHETRRLRPDLTVEAFHKELERLWSERVLELKVLNEVRNAAEPDKGVRRGDNLYYFVYWPTP